MKRFPIKVILLSLFIVINLTVICTFPTSMSDNDSEEVVNNLVTFLNKNDITVSPTIIDKETKKVSSATLQNFIEDRDAFAKNILGAKKEVTKNGETYTANENQVIFVRNFDFTSFFLSRSFNFRLFDTIYDINFLFLHCYTSF